MLSNLALSTDRPSRRTTTETGTHSHTVYVSDGLEGVNRVVSLLRQRRYQIHSLVADLDQAATGHTVLTFAAGGTDADSDLLNRRLQRLPTVLAALRN